MRQYLNVQIVNMNHMHMNDAGIGSDGSYENVAVFESIDSESDELFDCEVE